MCVAAPFTSTNHSLLDEGTDCDMSLSAPSLLHVTHMLSQQYRDGYEQYHAAIISFRCSTPSAFESRCSAEKGPYRVLMTRVRLAYHA